MRVNVFIRQIVVHDTRDPGDDPGEYDIAFAAYSDAAPADLKTTPRWTNSVRRAEQYEILEWLGPLDVQDGVRLIVAARGREHDFIGSDELLGGVAYLTGANQWGLDHWWRTRNGKHFDIVFAVSRAEAGHAGRPPFSGHHGEIGDAPGPTELSSSDYPAGLA